MPCWTKTRVDLSKRIKKEQIAKFSEKHGVELEECKQIIETVEQRGGSIKSFVEKVCAVETSGEQSRDEYYDLKFRPRRAEVAEEFHRLMRQLDLGSVFEQREGFDWEQWDDSVWRSWARAQSDQLLRENKGVGAGILPPRSLDFERVIAEMKRERNSQQSLQRLLLIESLCAQVFAVGLDKASKGLMPEIV